MLTGTILFAIILAIVVGYKTKINIGFIAIVFAYLIGCFMLDMKANAVIKLWPIKIFFIIMSVTLFYNFAVANGTLEKLAGHLMYRSQKYPSFLPFAVFISTTIIAGLGAGYYTVLAFMAPITLLLCSKTGMSRVVGGMAVNYGALAGANFMTSQSGIIFRGLMGDSGIDSNQAFTNSTAIFVTTFVIPIIVLAIFMFFIKKSGSIKIEAQLPEKFDQKQKQTLVLILIMMAIVLVFPILHLVLPQNESITFINSRVNIGFLSVVFSVIALLLKLADEKKVVSLIPWNTILMICGVGMLIGVAVKADVITVLSSWITTSIPSLLIPLVMCLVGALMSVFASTLGVVTPTLFPIVPAIAAASGHSTALLFVCIVVGAQASAISPFSSGGSLILGSSPAGTDKDKLFKDLLFKAVPLGLVAAVVATLIIQLFT